MRFRCQIPVHFVETVPRWRRGTLRFGLASRESALSVGGNLGGAAFGLVQFAPRFDAASQTPEVQVERATAAGLGEQVPAALDQR